jgi:cytochrome c551
MMKSKLWAFSNAIRNSCQLGCDAIRKTLRMACLPLPAYCLLLNVPSILVAACSSQDQKLQRYYVQGEELYVKNCSNCHQKNGKGLGLLYPPVDVSDYMDTNFNDVICLMEMGREGELIVNGRSYNKPMPAFPSLTDLEIAEITTYLYNSWGRQKGLVDVGEVTKIIEECK